MAVIKYRKVVNDAVCCPWEEMPEIGGTTLKDLVEYLKTCQGWDYRRLSTEHRGWNNHQISYGNRGLFWLPTIPTDEDFTWLEKLEDQEEKLVDCSLCGNPPSMNNDYYTMIGEEASVIVSCKNCDITLGIFKHGFIMSELVSKWNKLHSKRN